MPGLAGWMTWHSIILWRFCTTTPKTIGQQYGRSSWAEPWKIKMVEPIRMNDRLTRGRALKEVGYNTDLCFWLRRFIRANVTIQTRDVRALVANSDLQDHAQPVRDALNLWASFQQIVCLRPAARVQRPTFGSTVNIKPIAAHVAYVCCQDRGRF